MISRFGNFWVLLMVFSLISSYEVDEIQSPDKNDSDLYPNLLSESSLDFSDSSRITHDKRRLVSCSQGCSSCTSSDYYQCTSCNENYYLLNGECLKLCPNGFSSEDQLNCKLYNNEVFEIKFNQILGNFDTKNSTYLICGNNPNKFYPNYDENDPFPAKDRGYYFKSSSSYMQMAPNEWSPRAFIPNINHTVSIWAFLMNSGDWSLLHKNNANNQKEWAIRIKNNYLFYEWTRKESSSSALSSYDYTISSVTQRWNSYVLTFERASGTFTSKAYINKVLIGTQSYTTTGKFVWDEDGIFRIGFFTDESYRSGIGWDGYIAEIAFYAVTLSSSEVSNLYGTCTSSCSSLCPVSGDCFSTCNIYHYADSSGSCSGGCDETCSNPCVYSNRCSLCYDSNNDNCFGFGQYDTLSYTCATNCLSCADSNYYRCTECNSGYYLYHGVCIDKCKLTYTASSGVCAGGGSYVYNFFLNKILGVVSDSYNFFTLIAGRYDSSFYPSPDGNDPIPSYQRGYYFNGKDYLLKLNTSIIFDYYQTHGFWLKKEQSESNQTILYAYDSNKYNYLGLYIDSSDKVILNITVNTHPLDESSNKISSSASQQSISNEVWTFYAIVITFIKGSTYARSYNFNEKSVNSIVADGVMYEASCSVSFGAEWNGNQAKNAFKGFMYQILYIASSYSSTAISQMFSSDCSGCTYCPLSSNCLVSCDHHYYYDYDYNECSPCKASCEYGCKTSTTCNLCDDPGCDSCSSWDAGSCSSCYYDATLNTATSMCECDDSSKILDYVSSSCSNCDSSCKVCIWPYMLECTSCPSGFSLMPEKICTPYCPDGCIDTNRGYIIVSFIFYSKIDNKMSDDNYRIPMFLGKNSSYYPNYDENDPKLLLYRGLYFSENSFARLPPNDYSEKQLILWYTHTIDMWIMPFSSGSWISKYYDSTALFYAKISSSSIQICYNFFSPSKNSNQLSCVSYSISLNSWSRVTWASLYSYTTQDLIIYLNGNQVSTRTLSGDYFFNEDIYADFVLGSDCCGSYFTGYIYSLMMYDYSMQPSPTSESCYCQSCTEKGACLSTCAFNEAYAYDNTCLSCPDNCSTGCASAAKCSICVYSLCSSCSSINKCSSCEANSSLDQSSYTCNCNEAYYYDSDLGSCSQCHESCLTCTNSTSCASCRSDFVINNGLCTCPSGKYYDSAQDACESCKSLCNTCSSATDCSVCIENATLTGDECYCSDGYTLDNNYCRQCSSCLTCSGVNMYDCTSCESGQYLTTEGICSTYCACGCNETQRNSAIVRYKFVNISNVLYDLEHSVSMYMGQSSSYYPNYEESDPRIVPYRGLYFDKYSLAYLPPNKIDQNNLYVGYSHTFDLWVYALDGVTNNDFFLYKSSSIRADIKADTTTCALTIAYTFKNITDPQTTTLTSYSYINSNEWVRISWTVGFDKGDTTYKLYLNGIEQHGRTLNGYFYDESNDKGRQFYLGPIIGFIYSFAIYNYPIKSFQMGNNDCGCQACTDTNDCLSTCRITKAYYKSQNTCWFCLGRCEDGCAVDNSCNLCYDLACEECSSYEAGYCIKCKPNYSLNSSNKCVCQTGYYADASNDCYSCPKECSSCTSSTYCLSCVDEQKMSLNNGVCSCSDGEYFNSTLLTCQPCKNLCLTCTSETSCTSCVSNTNAISQNTCTCSQRFYQYENTCLHCHSTCLKCSGPAMWECKSCPSRYLAVEEGLCADYCAYGCQDKVRNSMIANYTFYSITNQQKDSANQISLFMGSKSSYYPNYDLNDPKIIPHRGIYFNGNSSALFPPNSYSSSQLYLGFSHSVDVWAYFSNETIDIGTLMVKYYSENYLMRAEFVAVDGIFKVCYNLHALDLSSVSETCLDATISTNNWLRLTWTLKFKSGNTSMSLFNNGELVNSIEMSERFFNESFWATFSLGNYDPTLLDSGPQWGRRVSETSSAYFYGYIYSIKIYNYALTSISAGSNSCGCQHCTDLDKCLSTCKYNEAYNTTLNTCESCPSNCENGCAHSWACTLCDTFLCASCSGYMPPDCSSCVSNAHFNGYACECDTDYHALTKTLECTMCTDFCDVCLDYAANQCTLCITNYYLTSEGFCVQNCPLGYSYNGAVCSSEDQKSLVISYKFDQLLNTQKDEINQIPIEFGSSSSFYPSYDDSDPRVLQYRGLYFGGNQYANLPPNSAESKQIAFGFSHTVDMWIMPVSENGAFFSKYTGSYYILLAEVLGSSTYSLSISYRLTSINDGVTTSYKNLTSSGHSYSEWKRVSFLINYSSATSDIYLYINGNLENTNSIADMFFDENALAFINLGSYNLSSYYTGYIYSLKLYNYALDSFSQGTCECSACTEDNDCLVDCGKDKFYTSSTCESCLSTCTDGCIADNRCNLCFDPLCDTCSSFKENACTNCISNAIFDMVTDLCECSSGYIFNSTSEKCIACSSLCNTCEGRFDNCSSCNDGYYMNSGGLCLMNCSLGFSVVDNSCQSDDPNSMVAYFHFNELANTIYDSVSNLAIYMGNSDSYYPDYDANDPKTLPYRGIYFSGNSIASLQPNSASSTEIIFGISHSIELWIMPMPNSSYQTLTSKSTSSSVLMLLQLKQSGSDYDIYACYTVLDTKTSSFSENLCASSSTHSFNTWKKVTISLSYESGLTKLELYINGVVVGSSNISNYFYYENYVTSFMLGTLYSDVYFTGFIYSLKFYNYAKWTVNKRELQTGSSTCNCQECTDDGDCLTSCGAQEYYDSSSKTCKSCRSDCTNGCVRGTDCSLHPDEICETYTTLESGKCIKCLANGINIPPCTCDKHSSYSSSDRKCLCIENYQSFNNTCIYCWRYIQSSEISASFTSSFLKLVLTFPMSVNTTGVTCSSLFPTNVLEKFGLGYSCNFNSDATTFTVNLGYNFTLTNENISLKREILKQNNKIYCGYYPKNVTVQVEYTYSLPYPSAIIDAPTTVLYSCQNLTVTGYKSSGNVNHDLYYKWEISSNPSSSNLAKYNTGFQTSISQFTIPKSDLSDSIITITLTVKNYLSLTGTSSITVESVYSGLVVTFDKTVSYQLLAIDYVTYAIGAISACETSNEFSISWTIDSVSGNSSAINEAYFWGNQTSSDFIIIPQRAFPPNINIVFKAIVIDSVKNLEGSGLLSLIINPASPVVKVSRSSGDYGVVDDLAIDASSSYDPNEYKPLSFQWTCTYMENDCSSLLSENSKESLTIPKNTLLSGIEYQFTLDVFQNYNKRRFLANSRFLSDSTSGSSTTIVVMTVDYSTPTVSIIDIVTNLEPWIVLTTARLTLYAEISNSSLYTLQWSLESGGSISYESSLTDQYLIISKDSMEAGRNYTLNLLLNDGTHNSSYQCKFYTNLPPNAGSFTVSPSSGIESQTIFKLEALNWVDEEDNTPITYSYGYMNGTEYIYLNSKNRTSTYYTMFPYIMNKLTVFIEAFDSLGAFTRKTSEITISIDQNLNQSHLFTDIVNELDAANPQAYPGLVSHLVISILNRDWIIYGEYLIPNSGRLDFLLDVLSVSLHWTKLGINSMTLMDTQEVNTYVNLLRMMTRNPYLNSTTTEIAVCDVIDLMLSKIDTTKPFSDFQASNLFTVVDQSYVFNSTSLQNNTLALETALKILENTQLLIASQMAVDEKRSYSSGDIEIKVANKAVDDLDGYVMKSSNGVSGVSLPKDFSKVISNLTTSPYVTILMNVLKPSNDYLSMSSSIVDFSVHDPNTQLNLHASSLPSNISVQIQSDNVKYSNFTPECVYLDTVNKNWSSEGCTNSQLGNNYISCSCSHFSSFSLIDVAAGTWAGSNIDKTTSISSFSDINETNAAGLYFCAGTLLIYLVVGSYAWRKDCKDDQEEDEKRRKIKGRPVKMTKYIEDIQGKQESSSYEHVIGKTINTDENSNKATEVNDVKEYVEESSLSFDSPKEVYINEWDKELDYQRKTITVKETRKIKRWEQNLKAKHELLNIFFIKDLTKSRLSRATLLCFSLLGTMYFSGVFYDDVNSEELVTYNFTHRNQTTSYNVTVTEGSSDTMSDIKFKLNDLFIAIYTIIIMQALSTVLDFILTEKEVDKEVSEIEYHKLKRKNKTRRFIGIGAAIGIMIFFCWSIVLFSITFEDSVSVKWVLNSGVLYALKLFLTSWFKWGIFAFVLLKIEKMIKKRNSKREKQEKENKEESISFEEEGEEAVLNYKHQAFSFPTSRMDLKFKTKS